jgi:hypothetical protein
MDVMAALLRRVLPALLLAGGGVVAVGAAGAPALACPKDTAGLEQHAMRAADVFTGTVDQRRRQGKQVAYTVSVERVYKGRLNTTQATVTTSAAPRACGVPDLQQGSSYVFFTGGGLDTSADSGTTAATDKLVARVKKLLGDGRPATPPQPETATLTVVAGEPTSVQRVAAPGAALVLAGLLGLLLAGALGRRRA